MKNIINTKNIENIGQGWSRLGKTLVTRTRTHPKPVQSRSWPPSFTTPLLWSILLKYCG